MILQKRTQVFKKDRGLFLAKRVLKALSSLVYIIAFEMVLYLFVYCILIIYLFLIIRKKALIKSSGMSYALHMKVKMYFK